MGGWVGGLVGGETRMRCSTNLFVPAKTHLSEARATVFTASLRLSPSPPPSTIQTFSSTIFFL